MAKLVNYFKPPKVIKVKEITISKEPPPGNFNQDMSKFKLKKLKKLVGSE